MPSLTTLLVAIGTVTVLNLLYRLLRFAQPFLARDNPIYKFLGLNLLDYRPSANLDYSFRPDINSKSNTIFSPSNDHPLQVYNHGERGQNWALVTGATAGIGAAFAHHLLDRGFNVLLHGRNETKLRELAEKLRGEFAPLSVRWVLADAAAAAAAAVAERDGGIENIVRAVGDLAGAGAGAGRLTILVNNIGGNFVNAVKPAIASGMSSPGVGSSHIPMQDMTPAQIDQTLNVNARFPALLTNALLPTLIKNGPALVINVGSSTGLAAFPTLSVYSGSKAFNLRFSEGMRLDMKMLDMDRQAAAASPSTPATTTTQVHDGGSVEVLGLLVANTATDGNKSTLGLFTPSAHELAGAALDRVGCGRALVWAWWRHGVQAAVLDLLPDVLRERFFIDAIRQRREAGL